MNESQPDVSEDPIPRSDHPPVMRYEPPRLVSVGNAQDLLAGGEGSQDDIPLSPTHGP
jgi:hypothetical protein